MVNNGAWRTGQTYSHAERIRQLVAEIELADSVGLDVSGIGEHHRADFALSAPDIVLAACLSIPRNSVWPVQLHSVQHGPDSFVPTVCHYRCFVLWMIGDYGWKFLFHLIFPSVWLLTWKTSTLFLMKLDLLQLVNEKAKLDWQDRLTQTIAGKGLSSSSLGQIALWIATGCMLNQQWRLLRLVYRLYMLLLVVINVILKSWFRFIVRLEVKRAVLTKTWMW